MQAGWTNLILSVRASHDEGEVLRRLIAGGSLYPSSDVPTRYSRRVSVLIIIGCAIAAWAITALMVWPVLQ